MEISNLVLPKTTQEVEAEKVTAIDQVPFLEVNIIHPHAYKNQHHPRKEHSMPTIDKNQKKSYLLH